MELTVCDCADIYLPSVDTQGERLPVGSLCIVDRSPRLPESLTREQRETLRSLADMIARECTSRFDSS